MLLLYIIIATLLVSAISFAGIFVVYRKTVLQDGTFKLLISLAAGALLAVSFLDLLPEAVEAVSDPAPIFATVLVSFLLFFILEKYLHWHHCRCDNCGPNDQETKDSMVITNLVGDSIHNLMDGFLIATTFMLDVRVGMITTFAVVIHEIPQEIADFGVLLYAGLSKRKAIFINFLFALTAVVGGIAFFFFGRSFAHLIPFMAAFAAGNFLYLATSDLIPELHHEKDPKRVLQHTIWLLAGVAIIYLVTIVTPHNDTHIEPDNHGNESHYRVEVERSI